MEANMKKEGSSYKHYIGQEKGAAVVTVLLIAFLLLTASIALLSGVAAGTKNSGDMLSETKAYYAAESGLQATINALRHRNPKVKYSEATADPTMETYLTYNYQAGTPDQRIVIGQAPETYNPNTGEAYKINVYDPDNYGAGLTFRTDTTLSGVPETRLTGYTGSGGGVITTTGTTSTVTITDSAAPENKTLITMAPPSDPQSITFGDFAPDVGQLASFTISNAGAGANIPDGDFIDFQIKYSLTAPRSDATKMIYGKISKAAGALMVTVDGTGAELVGSTITFCSTQTDGCTYSAQPLDVVASPQRSIFARVTPVEPVRLVVRSTGYGPFGAKKELEAIIRKDIPNLSASNAANTMVGPSTCPAEYPTCLGFAFAPGTSAGVTYSGGNCSTGPCVPSFGLTDPNNLTTVNNYRLPNGQPMAASPPPELLTGGLPAWQQSPAAMDAFIDDMRAMAQGSDRYYVSSNGTTPVVVPDNPGNFTSGTGITFCEGSCQVGGSGGGFLVVTGKLTNTGNFSFRGLIVVVGEEGWLRNGGGNGQVIGNVVIAPYNRMSYIPENHTTSFLPPRYQITGGGGSDIIYGDITSTFSNTSGVSDIMQGIAEK
jgi:hypothetical protein